MHKPFIHCFKTAKEYYVYDVNTDYSGVFRNI